MLQPELARLLAGGQVLLKSCDEDCPSGDTHELRQREADEGNPFNYTPQLIHLHKDHQLFEVTQLLNRLNIAYPVEALG